MSTGKHVSDWDLTDAEVMVLSRKVLGWADRVFVAYPPIRTGQILDWCQELIDLRDEIDRVIWWRAIIKSEPDRVHDVEGKASS